MVLSFNACSSDDDNTTPGDNTKSLMISVYYKMKNSDYDYPDSNSKIFIIRNTGFNNTNYEYKGEGKFYKKSNGEWIEPAQSLSNEDNVTIEVKCDYDCTIVVESAHIEGSYNISEKTAKDNDRNVKVVFPAK